MSINPIIAENSNRRNCRNYNRTDSSAPFAGIDDFRKKIKNAYTGRYTAQSKRIGNNLKVKFYSDYSLVGCNIEQGILPATRDLGLGTMIWSSLAGGRTAVPEMVRTGGAGSGLS